VNLLRPILWLLLGAVFPGLAEENRVLQLDGRGSHVELPPAAFESLTQATVEAWVKFDAFSGNVRVFDFGARSHEMYLGCGSDAPDLKFLIAGPDSNRHRIDVPGILLPERWCHVAVTTGPDGVRLYYNGLLVGTNAYAGSFNTLGVQHNYIGRESFENVSRGFRGQIDEFRVWNTARSREEILQTMGRTMAGTEPGLVGLWNFDGGTPRDAGAGRRHGQSSGRVQFPAASFPNTTNMLLPSLIVGHVVDASGREL